MPADSTEAAEAAAAHLTLQSRFIKGKLAGLPFGNRFSPTISRPPSPPSPLPTRAALSSALLASGVRLRPSLRLHQSSMLMLILSSPLLQRQFIFSLIFEHRIRSVINGIRREVADDDDDDAVAALAVVAAQVATQSQAGKGKGSSSSAHSILPSQRQPRTLLSVFVQVSPA